MAARRELAGVWYRAPCRGNRAGLKPNVSTAQEGQAALLPVVRAAGLGQHQCTYWQQGWCCCTVSGEHKCIPSSAAYRPVHHFLHLLVFLPAGYTQEHEAVWGRELLSGFYCLQRSLVPVLRTHQLLESNK